MRMSAVTVTKSVRVVVFLFATILSASPARADLPPVFVLAWGTSGTAAGQFAGPYGIAVASDGQIYVTDQFNHRVQRFTATGDFIFELGSFGSGDGQFNVPAGLAVDSDGSL